MVVRVRARVAKAARARVKVTLKAMVGCDLRERPLLRTGYSSSAAQLHCSYPKWWRWCLMTAEAPGRVRAAVSVVAWVVVRAGREEQVGVVVAAMALEAAAARDQGKLGQEAAAARARETRAVEVAEAAVAVVKVELVAQAQEKMGLVAAAGRAQAAPAAAAEAEMAPEPAWRPASARARPSAWCWPSPMEALQKLPRATWL